jgi:hypothetical protein
MATSNLGRLKDSTKLVTGSVRQGDRFDTYQFRLNDRSSLKGTLGTLRGGNADLELFNGDRHFWFNPVRDQSRYRCR